MVNRTNGKKDGNQTWVDYLTYEKGSTMVSIFQAKQARKKTVTQHLSEAHGEKVEGMVLSLAGAGAMLGGVMLAAVPLAITGALAMTISGFAVTSRVKAQEFAEKEAQFLKFNDNFLLMLASLEQKGEIATLTAADMYNEGFARCTEGGVEDVRVVDEGMFREILANHVNGMITGTQATTKFAEAMGSNTPMELPPPLPEAAFMPSDEPWDDEPAPVPMQPYKYDLLAPAIDVSSSHPSVDRLDPAQMLRDVAAGQVAGTVAMSGGYPAAPIGCTVVPPSALNDINKYPFVMVVAGQGNGKSVSMAAIMTQLTGKKALSTPKADDHKNAALSQVYSLRFGFDPLTRQGQQFGDDLCLNYAASDLDELATGGPNAGTILEFARAAQMTANNRNARGKRSTDQPWRIFYDEAAQTYSVGFLQLGKKPEETCKLQIEAMLKYGLFNFRGSGIQLFIGCQSETVDTIGMKNVSAARDEAWHLYPGRIAIEKARIYNQPAIAAYLERLLQGGYAIALLEKQGVIFEVLQLPKLAELKKYDPIVDADNQPTAAQVATVIEVPTAQPVTPIPQADQMAQMLQAMVASGMIPDPQQPPENDYRTMFSQMQQESRAEILRIQNDSNRKIADLQRQLADQQLAIRQQEIRDAEETDEEYGAIDPEESQSVDGLTEFDAMAALEDALIGAKQELELAGKSGQEVFLTARKFSKSLPMAGTKYDGNKPGGTIEVKGLFKQFAAENAGAYKLSITDEGTVKESWRIAPVSTTIKSTQTKAVRVNKR